MKAKMDLTHKGNMGLIKEIVPDEKEVMQWIAAKPLSEQEQATKQHFQELLEFASQPRHASGNACVKLCYFLEQCRKSTSAIQREVAFSHEISLSLFKFYVERDEKNQHRSMRQVLELLISLIVLNPDNKASSDVKMAILEQVLSIITHQAAQPLVKPAFKVLECFLNKDAISVKELSEIYGGSKFAENRTYIQCNFQKVRDPDLWHLFVYAVFEWMSLPDTSPAAGKLLVTLFQKLRAVSADNKISGNETYTILWQNWIRNGLIRHPDSLENIKNYLFPPLFKLDKVGSLNFLQDLKREQHFEDLESKESDAQAFLFLSAMEVGKKSGLVDEPSKSEVLQISNSLTPLDELLSQGVAKVRSFVILPEDGVRRFLSHKAGNVRSAAFSVLVSSISSTRPFPLATFNLLRLNLGLLYSDTDAKVRNEVLSNTKHMIGRIKGAMSVLTRNIDLRQRKHNQLLQQNSEHQDFANISSQEAMILQEHEDFILWYQDFLMNELIPTASYQRHITALKAIQLLVDSGILIPQNKTPSHSLVNAEKTLLPSVFNRKLVRLLLDLVMNPFEDVRAAATQLLKLVPESCFAQQHEFSAHMDSQVSSRFENTPNYSVGDTLDGIPTNAGGKERFQNHKVPGIIKYFIQKAETASRRTGRADLADGVARAYELIYCLQTTDEARLDLLEDLVSDLEKKVVVAEKDLVQAVLLAPIHGQFAALRLVWELFSQSNNNSTKLKCQNFVFEEISELSNCNPACINLQYRMIGCCTRIWAAVKEVLCNDSPEGHLPQDLDDIDTLDTKDVLSYSFRAIHESSCLLRAIVSKLKLNFADGSAIMHFDLLQAAGNLSFEQLSNLRHRGAFSTVSLTFSRCCQLTQENSLIRITGASLLQQWYQGAIMCIYEQSSTTRRSAGIPALITGILSANSKSLTLGDVMAKLKILAHQPAAFTVIDETNLPQVHAMNCLKEIFKSSTLGKRCDTHIADCLQIAAESLKSKIWAIRNCGLLLLRSLIDCLFGTSESKFVTEAGWDGKSIRLVYERYPTLPEILLNLMAAEPNEFEGHTSPQVGTVQSVFPALDIIRRAGPPKKLRIEIYSSIKVHLGSNLWHVRDIAARTICTLLLEEGWLEGLTDLLETCGGSSNQIHGVLLATKYFLERRLELKLLIASEGLIILNSKIDRFWSTRPHWMLNAINKAAFVEVGVIMLKIMHLTGSRAIGTYREGNILERFNAIFRAENVLFEEQELAITTQPALTERSSVLLIRAANIRALYTGNMNELQKLIMSAIQCDVDIACYTLDHIPIVWDLKKSMAEDLLRLVDIYIGAYIATLSNSIRNIALRNLADILEHLFQSGLLHRTDIAFRKFQDFGLFPLARGSPDLSNAEIRVTGSLLALDFFSNITQGSIDKVVERIQDWGNLLIDSGKSENDFDTRYAAVAALCAFYCACGTKIVPSSQTSFFVPSLIALYDTLNDDDDEIRDGGANVVSHLLGSHQAPLAASTKLLEWLYQKFGKTQAFRSALMRRIANGNNKAIGMIEPAEQQLTAAMLDDESLFVEEEQNLYIDEIREAIAWTSLIAATESPLSDEETSQMSSWAEDGLHTLARLAETNDGPFGWSSKPRVFAICMTIILAANAIITHQNRNSVMVETEDRDVKGKPLHEAMHRLLKVGSRNHLHPVLLNELVKSNVYST